VNGASDSAPSDSALSAYLEEALPVEQMAEIERRLRDEPELRKRLSVVVGRQDAGLHSVGVIWRRNRLSCPSRDVLGQYLLGVLDVAAEEYIRFHLTEIGCRYCLANHDDLRASSANEHASENSKSTVPQTARQRRYFETSAGHLRKQ